MKNPAIRGLIFLLFASCHSASFGSEQSDPNKCVLSSLQNGQIVTLRGTAANGAHDLLLKLPGCAAVVLTYADEPDNPRSRSSTSINLPRETHVADGPPLELRVDQEFKRFEEVLNATYKVRGCIGCYKYDVEATFAGRLDISRMAGFTFDETKTKIVGMDGFGHPMPFTRFRLVVVSVTNVVSRQIPKRTYEHQD